jgi:predicted phosphodiesterase
MAKVLSRDFFSVTRSDSFKILPVGDVHIGAAACDEDLFASVVKRIKDDDTAYWFGMGDYADFINMKDPRWNPGALAPWITITELCDLAKAQKEHYLDYVLPIAGKCLGMVCGNHESAIQRHFERDIYSEIVTAVKQAGGFPSDTNLAVGYYGYWRGRFYRSGERERASIVTINLHHGFTGGKLAGAKALDMQRWLWSHESADLVIFGHSHNSSAQAEAVECLDDGDNIVTRTKRGVFSGTFLKTVNEDGPSTYSEVKGYLPLPMGGCEVWLTPGAEDQRNRIRVVT